MVHDRGSLNGVNNGKNRRHRTETGLRLQLDSKISDKVSMRARWNIIGNENNGLGLNSNEWYGGNKNTADVEIAYLKVKDLLGHGNDFKFGRDWYQHGHGFVVHNYMDAVSYSRRSGDIDLAMNMFFERQNGDDYYNIWNINADYNYKGHDLYFGIYYNERAYDNNNVKLAKNEKEVRYEAGSSGKLSNNNDKLTYDLGVVYSDIENGNGVNRDAQGILGHVAFKYDSKKDFNAKFAFTYADDESDANVNVENFNSYCEGNETIFDDLYLVSMAYNANTNLTFKNLNDYKLQFGFKARNNDKHNFRLAYDYLNNRYENKANTFNVRIWKLI